MGPDRGQGPVRFLAIALRHDRDLSPVRLEANCDGVGVIGFGKEADGEGMMFWGEVKIA